LISATCADHDDEQYSGEQCDSAIQAHNLISNGSDNARLLTNERQSLGDPVQKPLSD